ncbi:MAG: FtsX-like permease family protein [Fulvivirga sp.]|uniref:ABC transporter permease n=1 Tax=Fulvivirga sp. TaxID=1931237 RepID=UPI0032EF885B
MIRNYIKIAIRNFLKNKLSSAISITGLSIGLASVLIISLYVEDELSYDKFHNEAEDIYRIAWWGGNPQTRTPHPMAQELVKDFSQVKAAVSLSPIWGPGLTKQTFSIQNPNNNLTFDETDVLSVDSTFFDVFSFNLISGDKAHVLRNVGGVLLSESTANKYFGSEDAVGKQLTINNGDNLLVVEGVFEDVPVNSHFHFDFLISYVTLKAISPDSPYYTWADFGHFNYIKLQSGSDPIALQGQLMNWAKEKVAVSAEDLQRALDRGDHFKLQPLIDIHLQSNLRWELEANGNMGYVLIMTAAAILILIIACVNFMNLTTAKSTQRSLEIGVRKSLGAQRQQLRTQYLTETVLTSILSMLIAGLLAEVLLPWFNSVSGKELSIDYFQHVYLILILVGSALFTGLISGVYPAYFMSSLNPVSSLKGDKQTPKGAFFRKQLTVLQFIISMCLLSGSLVIYNQIDLLSNKDLGYDPQSVVVVPLKNYGLLQNFEALKNELENVEGVVKVSAASNVPGKQFNQNAIFLTQDPNNSVDASEIIVDQKIFEVLSIGFSYGRAFSPLNPADSGGFIINETAAKQLNLEDPIGQELTWDWDNNGAPPAKGQIIGVVKDFNYNSLHEPIRPLLFYMGMGFNELILKINSPDLSGTMAQVEQVWRQFEDRFGFEYSILASNLDSQYHNEQQTAQVFTAFSIVAILIACFGLFGMATLSFAKRTKEIGIRKVLGASVGRILGLLLREFVVMLGIAICIAIPLTWLIMDSWLNNFTYRIDQGFLIYMISGLALLTISIGTIIFLTLKSAQSNPVKALREQ